MISSGATIRELKNKLQSLYPNSKVDICFLYDFSKNKELVSQTGFFQKCINPKEIIQTDFFNNVEILYKMVTSKEFREKL